MYKRSKKWTSNFDIGHLTWYGGISHKIHARVFIIYQRGSRNVIEQDSSEQNEQSTEFPPRLISLPEAEQGRKPTTFDSQPHNNGGVAKFFLVKLAAIFACQLCSFEF